MAPPTVTPAERIRDLLSINAEVPAMLSSAGKAISALTNKSLDEENINGDSSGTGKQASVMAHKEAFTENARAYFVGLQGIMARLRRQAYALEEAGIIAAEAPALSTAAESIQRSGAGSAATAPTAGMARRGAPGMGSSATQRQQATDEPDKVTNGGVGNLDVGLLNSRGNSVGMEKEAELIAEAKQLLKDMQAGSGESKE